MSKYRDELTQLIDAEIDRHPPDTPIKNLRTALTVQRDEVIFPKGEHRRIWGEVAHKAIQRILKERRNAKKNQIGLFLSPSDEA